MADAASYDMRLGVLNLAKALEGMDSSGQAKAREALKKLSSSSKEIGLADCDLLISLGEGRDALDPFGIFCSFYGRMMKYLGTVPTVVISLLAILALIEWLVRNVGNLWEWVTSAIGSIPGMLWGGVKGVFGFDRVEDSALSKMSTEALKGFVYGLLPAPIAGAMGAVVGLIGSGESGPRPLIDRPAIDPGMTHPPYYQAPKKKKSALKKLWGWLTSDGEAPTEQDIFSVAQDLDMNPAELQAQLAALQSNADEGE